MALHYLLDTSVYSQVLRPRPVFACVDHWKKAGDQSLAVSTLCISELESGLFLKGSDNLWLQYRTSLQGRLRIFDFDAVVATTFGRCKARQQQLGKRVDDFDLGIAATAITHGLILATLNTRHFRLVEGLLLEDWGQPSS